MSELEEKLGSVLSNPQLMQQIMAMAQTLGNQNPAPKPPEKQEIPGAANGVDPAVLQKLAGILNQRGTDGNQKALLRALSPYLGRDRMARLERAMGAAAMAGAASAFLGAGGLQALSGR